VENAGRETEARLKRGIALLAFYALGAVLSAVLLALAWADYAEHGKQIPPVLPLSVFSALLQLIAVTGLWYRRKWGLYLIGVLATLGLPLELAHRTPALIICLRIVLVCALAFIVVPYWERIID
jgi:uncharacterized membrane protein (DUF2068 family)